MALPTKHQVKFLRLNAIGGREEAMVGEHLDEGFDFLGAAPYAGTCVLIFSRLTEVEQAKEKASVLQAEPGPLGDLVEGTK